MKFGVEILHLKPISFKNNLKPPIDPKICTVQPSISCKQKGFETKSGTFKVVCGSKSYILSSEVGISGYFSINTDPK